MTVYFGISKQDEAVYTGITKQTLLARLYQHNYKGKNFSELIPQFNNLTRNQARSIEQYFIEKGPANVKNEISSISSNSKYYNEAMMWAETYIKNKKK